MERIVSLASFLAERGLGAAWFSEPALHRSSEHISPGQRRRQLAHFEKQAAQYAESRRAAVQEYQAAVEAGEIQQPRLSHAERLTLTAAGHPDNPSVQAAHRLLIKIQARP